MLISQKNPTQWKDHKVRLLNGKDQALRLPAKLQIITESWNRVIAVPYIVHMPEKDRLLMLVGCDYPHHAEVLFSDDLGATWTDPKPILLDECAIPLTGMGMSLTYLGSGKLLILDELNPDGCSRWFSSDYGHTWGDRVSVAPTPDGMPWHSWDPLWVDRNPETGSIRELMGTGYTLHKPPEVEKAHQQGYIQFSSDEGRTWYPTVKVPQWKEISEVALLRVSRSVLVAACRTDIPPSKEGEWIDHYEGLGISFSKDDGRTWSEVQKLYDWGRHHPSMLLLPDGSIVMTYVVRKGYVDSADGYPQFGIEAIVSHDCGRTWDLDHRYILHAWKGNRKGENGWWASSQATSTVMLPDDSLLTAFGTGYRSRPDSDGMNPAPRDVGLVKWHLREGSMNGDRTVRDAPVDSDERNMFDPDI